MAVSLKKKRVTHRCVRCKKEFPHAFRPFCDCEAMIDTFYDLDCVEFHESINPLERYFDLIPIEDPENLLPLQLARTPCVHAEKLGKLLGMPHLYLKDETKLPTHTTKDRMAGVALSYIKECGINAFSTSSTGNSSSAFAHAAKLYPSCRIFLFTAEAFAERVLKIPGKQVVHFVLRDGTFVEAFECAGAWAKKKGIASEGGFFNPGRREGLKLAYLEAVEQIPRAIDWYVQAISSAMGVYGTHKGARELRAMGKIERMPRLLCVQEDTCSPVVRAFLEGAAKIDASHVVPRPTGIAKAILRGDPARSYGYTREILLESNGTCTAVSEANIREARQMIHEYEGLDPCFSASTAFAGLLRLVRAGSFPTGDTVMVNLTGGDRPPTDAPASHPQYLRRAGRDWEPEDPSDPRILSVWPPPG